MAERRVVIAAWGALVAALAGCEPAAIPEQQPAVVSSAETGAAIVTVDVPEGMDVKPGGATLGILLYRTGNVGLGRHFPMTEIETRPLADGRTRHVFRLGESQTAALLAIRGEAARPGSGERAGPEVAITPSFELCRTSPVPDERPTIVTSRVVVESRAGDDPADLETGPTIITSRLVVLPALESPSGSKDLHDIAGRRGGRGFETSFELCSDA
jgi:hypothetical protein